MICLLSRGSPVRVQPRLPLKPFLFIANHSAKYGTLARRNVVLQTFFKVVT